MPGPRQRGIRYKHPPGNVFCQLGMPVFISRGFARDAFCRSSLDKQAVLFFFGSHCRGEGLLCYAECAPPLAPFVSRGSAPAPPVCPSLVLFFRFVLVYQWIRGRGSGNPRRYRGHVGRPVRCRSQVSMIVACIAAVMSCERRFFLLGVKPFCTYVSVSLE